MAAYVFDTEPLIAFFYSEAGHGAVVEVLVGGDGNFDTLSVDITVEQFHEHGV